MAPNAFIHPDRPTLPPFSPTRGRCLTSRQAMASTPKRSGREPQLLKSVRDAARNASSVEEALRAALQRICAATGWQAGRVEFADEIGALARHIVWHLERPERLGTLRRIA